jgi:hypothetical protein
MVIALLIALGVDLIVIVALAGFVVVRRRHLAKLPGAFVGAIRVSSGDIDGLRPKWKKGCGRWVRDVLVWTNGPLMLRTALVPVYEIVGSRTPEPGEVKRLDDQPVAVEFGCDDAKLEIAAESKLRPRVVAPFSTDPTSDLERPPSAPPSGGP